MSTTTKIDFDPALFGEQTPEDAEQPFIPLKPKPRRWPFVFLAFIVIAGIGVMGFVITNQNVSSLARHAGYQPGVVTLKSDLSPSINASELVGRLNPNIPVMQGYSSPSNRWCDGDETICTTTTTAKPTETLQKLIAAIPQGKAKQYKVRLSVTPIEEVDDSAK